MKEITIRKGLSRTKLRLFDESDFTNERSHVFYKNFILDSGVGSTPESINQRLANLFILNAAKERKQYEIETELQNLFYSLISTIQSISYKSRAFLSCVESINGKYLPLDITEEEQERVLKDLARKGLKENHVTEEVESLKKKLIIDLGITI